MKTRGVAQRSGGAWWMLPILGCMLIGPARSGPTVRTRWSAHEPGTSYPFGSCRHQAAADSQGNVYILAKTIDPQNRWADLVVSYTPEGTRRWVQRYSGVADCLPAAAQPGGSAAARVDPQRSGAAVRSLRAALSTSHAPLLDLAARPFARVPLSKADAAVARVLLWNAHRELLRDERAAELRDHMLRDGELEMPFHLRTFGPKPAGGHSLYLSLHGGGNAPKPVNDAQWENQKRLYTLEEGIYLAPRAPTNTWNLWHEPHIDRLFGRLIEDLVALEDVNPDRVYLLGYSAGGDGVYQLAPRLADYWAGAAMMAGHPNGVSVLSLRNVPFALQVGANDAAYDRNRLGKEYGDQLARLREEDPQGYEHWVTIHMGKGHWMDGEDRAALPSLARFTRNPIPARVVWKQTGVAHERSYWLAVPPGEAQNDALVIARRAGQSVVITAAEKVSTLLIHLDDRMADLDRAITITQGARTLYRGPLRRTIGTLVRTLAGRGDAKLMFDGEVAVQLKASSARDAQDHPVSCW